MDTQFRLLLRCFGVTFLCSSGLSACDSQYPDAIQTATQSQPNKESPISVISDDKQTQSSEGVALTEVAGQATVPHVASKHTTKLARQDLHYVGRYHARIPCTDAFAGCVKGEKEAEYILNLLEDGSVYWTNTSFGRLSSDSSRNMTKIEQTCKQVQWHVQQKEKEIIVRCDAANVNLYYQINRNHDLVLDLEQIWNGDHGHNRQFFKEYPFPQQAYVFKKVK